ncbi:Uncharacterised protein [uncultured Clostridium sp.]|nr:Uncharacterised protein [uncultured Clostridium sp.]SCI89669.1 Uncharacterised protein [uncultured Clostridium sp.]
MNNRQVVKLKNSDIKDVDFRKLNNRGENFITESGVYRLVGRSNSLNKKRLLKALGHDDFVIVDRFETSFGKALTEVLEPMNIEVECQKSMFNGRYKIDFYLPKYNLAIEYDEEQHKYRQEEDKFREEEIINELNCKFIRLNYKQTDIYNIGMVMNKIMN